MLEVLFYLFTPSTAVQDLEWAHSSTCTVIPGLANGPWMTVLVLVLVLLTRVQASVLRCELMTGNARSACLGSVAIPLGALGHSDAPQRW